MTGTNILGETVTRRRPQDMTDEEIRNLGATLSTAPGANIYAIVRSTYNVECGQANDDEYLFKRIKSQCGLFRCELCSTWLCTSEEGLDDVCLECSDDADDDVE